MDFLANIFIIVLIPILIGSLVNQYLQHERIRDELYKLVRQTGARNISIESDWIKGNSGTFIFRITYRDINGKWQMRRVSRHINGFGQVYGEFLFDPPLFDEPDSSLSSRLSSKEQIISDMDAEIKRLQQELEKAHKES